MQSDTTRETKKAESILNAEGVQFPNRYAFDSVNRNITDVGLKVKPQTETLQFKKFFKNSKVVDENGNPQADLTEVTVLATNKGSNIPPHKPLSEVVEAVAQHQAAGFSPSTSNNIPQSGEKSNPDLEFSRKRLHQQINPIMRDGKVRGEYADLLANKEYAPTTLK